MKPRTKPATPPSDSGDQPSPASRSATDPSISHGSSAQDSPIRIRVHYPDLPDRLRLRAAPDWQTDIAHRRAARDGSWRDFELAGDAGHCYFKPVLTGGDTAQWARGENQLALAGSRARRDIYPHFAPDSHCEECDEHKIPSSMAGVVREVRVFLPPGYHENTLQSYPVIYMQDGHNLFFPEQAHLGRHWRIRETLAHLDRMCLIRPVIVVGVYPRQREEDYTSPGYRAYGRFLVDELKPWVDSHYRTLATAESTAVLGSSLGGVVSLYLGWQHPETFGMVGAMSSTFGYRDDLLSRIRTEPRRPLRIYLDSGWPGDNYEATRVVHCALHDRGWSADRLCYLAFPEGRHDEDSWAARVHIPFQFFFREPW